MEGLHTVIVQIQTHYIFTSASIGGREVRCFLLVASWNRCLTRLSLAVSCPGWYSPPTGTLAKTHGALQWGRTSEERVPCRAEKKAEPWQVGNRLPPPPLSHAPRPPACSGGGGVCSVPAWASGSAGTMGIPAHAARTGVPLKILPASYLSALTRVLPSCHLSVGPSVIWLS